MSVAYSSLPYFIRGIVSESTYLYGYAQWAPVGQPVTLNFNFATAPVYGEQNFLPYTETQKTNVREALARYADVSGLAFTEVAASATAEITFFRDDLVSGGSAGYHGYAFYPYIYHPSGGDVHIHSGYYPNSDTYQPGNYAFQLVLHEIGHALGLVHTFEYPGVIPVSEDTQANSIMTYNNQWPYAQDLSLFDLAAIHTLYGVNPTARAGANIYSLADRYIWDGGGVDTLDGSDQTLRLNIHLTEGSWIWAGTQSTSILAPGQAFIGYGTHIEHAKGGSLGDVIEGNALSNTLWGLTGYDVLRGLEGRDTLWGGVGNDKLYGGIGNDLLYGGSGNDFLRGDSGNDTLNGWTGNDELYGGAGNDVLNGGSGNDALIGGTGKDTLTGGTGNDVFVFLSAQEAGKSAGRDVISDFVSGVDFIHLAAVDADSRTQSVHEAFAFIGSTGFTGAGAELRYSQSTGLLAGDVNGDSVADFQVELVGAPLLIADDLII